MYVPQDNQELTEEGQSKPKLLSAHGMQVGWEG